MQYPLNVSPTSVAHPATEVMVSSFPPRSIPSVSFKYNDSADFPARTTMNNYNIRPNNINVNTNTNTNTINCNPDSFSPPFSIPAAGTEAKPIVFPQHQQAFSRQPNGNNNSNMSLSKNDSRKGENFKNNNDDDNDNNNKKRSEALSESDISVNTNKKRLSVDYILT